MVNTMILLSAAVYPNNSKYLDTNTVFTLSI